MTFSFLVSKGDLALTGNQLAIVSGLTKLQQDMQLWVAERYGVDRFHPTYGSMLQYWIGGVVNASTNNRVSKELLRVLDNYQRLQLKAFKANPQLFSLTEMLASIDAVNISITYDTVQGAISFTNGSGNAATFTATATTV